MFNFLAHHIVNFYRVKVLGAGQLNGELPGGGVGVNGNGMLRYGLNTGAYFNVQTLGGSIGTAIGIGIGIGNYMNARTANGGVKLGTAYANAAVRASPDGLPAVKLTGPPFKQMLSGLICRLTAGKGLTVMAFEPVAAVQLLKSVMVTE